MSHIEHFVHLVPGRTALFLDRLEQWGNGEHIVLDHTAIVSDEVHYLGLCAA